MPKSKKITLFDRLRYAFDRSMAAGTVALIGWLALVSFAVIVTAALILTIGGIRPEGGERLDVIEAAWESLMRTLDPGTMGGDTGWAFRMVMFGVTLAGVLIVSSLIGVLTSGIESRLAELRKGRSFVIEEGHTLILGWSPYIFSILSELAAANANKKKACVVVLADKDKVVMEDEIRSNVTVPGRMSIICRTGCPTDRQDLEIVNPADARSIIILSSERGNPDAQAIKTMLALTRNSAGTVKPYHIVAEIRNPKNLEAARLVGRDVAHLVLSEDVLARITVQTCRHSGMSAIYTELLDFSGNEIYFQEEPTLIGGTFGDALMAYETAAVIGLQRQGNAVELNPPLETCIAAGDKIIAIAEDDDHVAVSSRTKADIDAFIDTALMRDMASPVPTPERTLLLGWNRRGSRIISQLDNYVAPGSEATVVVASGEACREIEQLSSKQRNLTVSFQQGDVTERRVLEGLAIPTYQHVVVLSEPETWGPQEADTMTLITLLHLRHIVEQSGQSISIVSEMLDIRNRDLAEVTRVDDFIVSDKLISLMLAQVSENRYLNAVLTELLDAGGSEIYLKPMDEYVSLNQPMPFYTVVASARRRAEVTIGYHRHRDAGDPEKGYGVVINPARSQEVTFAEGDRIIVLAHT